MFKEMAKFYLQKNGFIFTLGTLSLIFMFILTLKTSSVIDNREASMYLDYIKQILTAAATLAFGYISTEYKRINEIDKIAKRANEKIVKSCSEMIQIAQDIENQMQKNSPDHYQVIIENFAQNVRNLGKRNITLANDWMSVTSDKLSQELSDVAKEFESLESKKDEYKQLVSSNADQDKLDALESQIQAKVERLEAKSFDVQGISSYIKTNNMSIVEWLPGENNNEKIQRGQLIIDVTGNSKNVNGTGKLIPKMDGIPEVTVNLLKSPENSERYTILAKAGTNYDFHVHMKHSDNNIVHGRYVFEYTARLANKNS